MGSGFLFPNAAQGRSPFPSLLHFGYRLRGNRGPTHPLSGPHGGAVILQPHSHHMPLQGQPGRRAPLPRPPQPPRNPGGAAAQTHRSRPGPGSLSLCRGAVSALAHAHAPHTPGRTLGRTLLRAHAATHGRTHTAAGPGTAKSATAPRGLGRTAGPPEGAAGRPAPPRPSNPPSGARCGLQSFAAPVRWGVASARAWLGSTGLRTAVTAGPGLGRCGQT